MTNLHVPWLGERVFSLQLLLRHVFSAMACVTQWVGTVNDDGGIVLGPKGGSISDRCYSIVAFLGDSARLV